MVELIKGGADVDEADKDGTTTLMQAASKGYVKIVRELLRAGANPNATNKVTA